MDFKRGLLIHTFRPSALFLKIFTWAIVLFPSLTNGQGTSDVDPSVQISKHELAPVAIDGSILFYVRGVSAYPADVRAATIRKRIYEAARNYSGPADSVIIIPQTDRMLIYSGKVFIMNVYDEDGDTEGVNKELLAEIIKAKIKTGIEEYWHDRSPVSLKANVVKAAIALGLILVLLVIFIWSFRRLNEAFKQRIKHRIEKLENVSFKLIQSNQMLRLFHTLYWIIRFCIIAIVVIIFLNYVLGLFPWTRGFSNYVFDLILDPIRQLGRECIAYLPSLVFLIIIFGATNYILKLIRLFFTGLNSGGIVIQSFYPEWSMPTYKIIRFLIIVFAVVVAYPYIPGSGSSAFQGISVFLGVLFSLGSSSFIANVIAGYSMTFRRAFKIGDRIQVNEIIGYVESQSLMATRLRSYKNEEIVVPNSIMLNSTVLNYSRKAAEKGLILHTIVAIGYGTSWRKVEAMLKLAADRTEGIAKEPAPFVLLKELGTFTILYEINAYCFDANKAYIYYTTMHHNILNIFNENNVQIMTPAYEGDPEAPKVVPQEEWNTPLENNKNGGTTLDQQ